MIDLSSIINTVRPAIYGKDMREAQAWDGGNVSSSLWYAVFV